jgi:hypothetical protein
MLQRFGTEKTTRILKRWDLTENHIETVSTREVPEFHLEMNPHVTD